jgi:oligopeptide transport system ATP-binding protein
MERGGMMALLEVKNLKTDFRTDEGTVHAVRDVSFEVEAGEALGIVGESGSGKSQTMCSIIGLLADNAAVDDGKVMFNGEDISHSSFPNSKDYEKKMNSIRGETMAMIFQDPMTFLNPVLKIGTQLEEPLKNHTSMNGKERKEKCIELMKLVGIPSPEKRLNQYPYEFSGGMRQRIIIAIALANNPKLVIADEPTTALDVTIQAQVLDLINELKEKSKSAVIMISHDLGVVAKLCDRIAIMYGGEIVEIGTDHEIFHDPAHPYTKGLLQCVTNPEDDSDAELKPIAGSPPDLLNPPKGCPFVDRCEKAMRVCRDYAPAKASLSRTHECSCWLLDERVMNHE